MPRPPSLQGRDSTCLSWRVSVVIPVIAGRSLLVIASSRGLNSSDTSVKQNFQLNKTLIFVVLQDDI